MVRTTESRLQDIVDAIESVHRKVAGVSREAFAADPDRVKVVTYDLLVIGEATNHLPDELRQRHPAIPWPKIRGLRNLIVHEYFAVDPHLVWLTATKSLPPLLSAIRLEKERLTRSP